jgi:alkanesulfonate monooxygenase SsuD/methylene tetrahydromethanopterin reductase-like flavin-dependent oxidoreductase (luciferase family)
VKIICAGSSDEGLAFTAQYADYAFALGKGTNTPTAFAPVNAASRPPRPRPAATWPATSSS